MFAPFICSQGIALDLRSSSSFPFYVCESPLGGRSDVAIVDSEHSVRERGETPPEFLSSG